MSIEKTQIGLDALRAVIHLSRTLQKNSKLLELKVLGITENVMFVPKNKIDAIKQYDNYNEKYPYCFIIGNEEYWVEKECAEQIIENW